MCTSSKQRVVVILLKPKGFLVCFPALQSSQMKPLSVGGTNLSLDKIRELGWPNRLCQHCPSFISVQTVTFVRILHFLFI